MFTRRLIPFILPALLLTATSHAADYRGIFRHGGDLFEYAEGYKRYDADPILNANDEHRYQYYLGYITAAYDLMVATGNFCAPRGTIPGQLGNVAYDYMKNHPNDKFTPTPGLLLKAFQQAYPGSTCKA